MARTVGAADREWAIYWRAAGWPGQEAVQRRCVMMTIERVRFLEYPFRRGIGARKWKVHDKVPTSSSSVAVYRKRRARPFVRWSRIGPALSSHQKLPSLMKCTENVQTPRHSQSRWNGFMQAKNWQSHGICVWRRQNSSGYEESLGAVPMRNAQALAGRRARPTCRAQEESDWFAQSSVNQKAESVIYRSANEQTPTITAMGDYVPPGCAEIRRPPQPGADSHSTIAGSGDSTCCWGYLI